MFPAFKNAFLISLNPIVKVRWNRLFSLLYGKAYSHHREISAQEGGMLLPA